MPSITIVITTYNLQNFIADCLEDLLIQSFSDFDIVVIDDCSTDDTKNIVSKYIQNYPDRINAEYLQKNLGNSAKVRNWALDAGLISGEYVLFLDGDDRLDPKLLELLYNAAHLNKADISICAYDRVEMETGHVLCKEMRGFPSVVDLPPNDDILAFINGSLWNKLIKTSIIGNKRIPDLKVGEDLCFSHSLYRGCVRIAFINDILIHYQVHRASAISNTYPEMVYAFAEELLKIYPNTTNMALKDSSALIAFIHIGLSMAIRLSNNPSVKLDTHLKQITAYFEDNFFFFRGNNFFSIRTLRRHGLKGYAIWLCKLLYRMRCFRFFLMLYNYMVKLFHIDVKF